MLPVLVRRLDHAGVAIAELSLRGSSLDEVFLSLTGRRINRADDAGDRAESVDRIVKRPESDMAGEEPGMAAMTQPPRPLSTQVANRVGVSLRLSSRPRWPGATWCRSSTTRSS